MNQNHYLALLIVIAFVCNAQANENPSSIVGHRFIFDYGYTAYEINIDSESELVWTLVKGELVGPGQETNEYIYTQIADGILLLSWVENSGFGLSNVLNLNTGELITHGRDGNTVFVNQGKITRSQ